MKSGKQRRAELKAKRIVRAEKVKADVLAEKKRQGVAVNVENLAPYNSYGAPDFIGRGYYIDRDFTCEGCGREEVWTARQQKWWYETAKGFIYSDAKLCRACRRRERDRKAEARRVHLEGVARKKRSV
jgi:hypothetical protein